MGHVCTVGGQPDLRLLSSGCGPAPVPLAHPLSSACPLPTPTLQVFQGPLGASGRPCLQSWGGGPWVLGAVLRHSCPDSPPNQIKVEFSMKFTSRDMSLKRTPSKKQTGVFGVKISVVTKWVLPPVSEC